MAEKTENAVLTPKEVADLLRISLSTVYAAVKDGNLPAITLWRGRRKSVLRFRDRDIQKLLTGGASDRPGTPRLNMKVKGGAR